MTHADTAGAIPVPRPAAARGESQTVSDILSQGRSMDVLSRRAVPGRRAALDWVVVSRSGVYLVDEYDNGASHPAVRARQGGARTGRDSWVVVIDGEEQPHALAGLKMRAQAVRDALADAGWSDPGLVVPVLCVDRGGLPTMRRQLRLGSCLVVGSSGLSRLVRSGGAFGADARSRITRVLLEAFPALPSAAVA